MHNSQKNMMKMIKNIKVGRGCKIGNDHYLVRVTIKSDIGKDYRKTVKEQVHSV